MENKKNLINKSDNSLTNNFIVLILSVIYLFVESLGIIIGGLFKKGILKKEILSKKTRLGFDLIIKRK
tara:strand:+ start:443 stop:646 length:204 start_codon:yes stop_codon:yes gene_type:complete